MANSITGVNDDIISQMILETFVAETTPLRAFSTNFSPDAAKPGDKISILRTIAADAALDKTTHAAYTVQDVDSDAVEISLGQPKYVSWGLDDTEVANSSVVNMEVYAQQKGIKLATAVLADIWSIVLAATYTGRIIGAPAAFDTDDVADIYTDCDTALMPTGMRSLILKETYIGALKKDTHLSDASALGSTEVIREGSIGRLGGFDLYKSTLIPLNGENLVGMAAHPSGMAVAMRYLQPQVGNTYSRAESLSDPGSGITLGLRDMYDNITGRRIIVIECIFGKIAGIAAGIQRLTSA